MSHTLAEIEARAERYAKARDQLAAVVAELGDESTRLRRRYMPRIRRLAASAAAEHEALASAVDASRGLFKSPKSRLLHGIRVGLKKARGKLSWQDASAVVKLIRRHHADQFDVLVKVTETPQKDALSKLTAAELKKLGIELGSDSDEVVVKPADDAVDKLVAALLEREPEGEAEAAA